MLFDLTIIGFGVIGAQTLNGIKKILIKKKHKNQNNIKIAIVEKNLKNIPGVLRTVKKTQNLDILIIL